MKTAAGVRRSETASVATIRAARRSSAPGMEPIGILADPRGDQDLDHHHDRGESDVKQEVEDREVRVAPPELGAEKNVMVHSTSRPGRARLHDALLSGRERCWTRCVRTAWISRPVRLSAAREIG